MKFNFTPPRFSKWVVVSALVLASFGACQKYDDSELRNLITDLQNENSDLRGQIKDLKSAESGINSDIKALNQLVSTLETSNYITSVTALPDGSGYTIAFANGEPVTVHNGAKGEDGLTPKISVGLYEGAYYWTLDGEWLTDDNGNRMPVTGEKGDTGATGAKGDKGDKGDKGEKGDKGATGDSGAAIEAIAPQVRINTDTNEWEISTDSGETWKSTGVKATGEKGEKGDTGAQGIQGEKGDKGDQGEQGIQGEKGEKGDTGAQGIQGEKGEKGDTGAQGIQGENGDKGDQGEQGIQGEKGEKGDTGAQGIQGEKGDKGDTGATGATGAAGKDGTDGNDGADGKDGVTPLFKIVDGNWMVSYDNGASWSEAGSATAGTSAGSVIKNATVDEYNHLLKITLADGTEIPVYYGDNPYIELDRTSTTATAAGDEVTIKVNASGNYSVSCDGNGNWVTYTNSGDTYTITIAPNKSSASRTAKVVFNCRNTLAEFTINQEGYPVSGTNSWDSKMETVLIKAGTFTMGSPTTETDRCNDETQHQVTLTQDFYMGKYEVTNAQFCEFLNDKGIGSNGKYTTADYGSQTLIYTNSWGVKYSDGKWAPQSGYDNYPVNCVTWYGANEYAKWIGGALPTEAQWEYACRAGSTTAYSFGDDSDGLGDYAWYYDNSSYKTHPVGQKKPNAWGLYDMHGNVEEWCADWYDSYSTTAVTDPTGPTSGSDRVVRGGGWSYFASYCRSANRNFGLPGNSYNYRGFRVCFPL